MLTLLAVIFIIAFIGAVLSLFIPQKVGFFLKTKTRSRVFACYFAILVLSLIVVEYFPQEQANTIEMQKDGDNAIIKDLPEESSDITIVFNDEPSQAPIKDEVTNTTEVIKQDAKAKSKDASALRTDFAQLYDELMGFKGNTRFHSIGFGEGGEYNGWLVRLNKARDKYDGIVQIQQGLVFGELAQMGLDYMRSKGNGTKYTQDLSSQMRKALGR